MEHGAANDVFTMHHHRAIWRRVNDLVQANEAVADSTSAFWSLWRQTYSNTQAIAVRRQADTDDQLGSIARVIQEMTETPEAMTREFWLSQWRQDEDDPYWQQVAAKQWDDYFGGGDHLDPAIPAADIEELQAGSARVKEYVDLHVAHMDARTIPRRTGPPRAERPVAPPTRASDLRLDEIHDGIDLVGRMFVKYAGLLTAATWTELTPIIQDDWEGIFEVPWKPPRPKSRSALYFARERAREAAEDEAD